MDLAAALRKRSLAIASGIGCKINDSLPLLDANAELRPKREVEDRALCMHAVVAVAFGFPAARAYEWLAREELVESLTTRERTFLREPRKQVSQYQSHVEALWVFAWALSAVQHLDFEQAASDDLVNLYPNLKTFEEAALWRSKNRLRASKDVLAADDLAYCLHWACMNAQHKREQPNLNPLVVTERRRVLDWMVGTEPWDEIPLDT